MYLIGKRRNKIGNYICDITVLLLELYLSMYRRARASALLRKWVMYITSFINKKGTSGKKQSDFGQLVDKVLVDFSSETFETPSGE